MTTKLRGIELKDKQFDGLDVGTRRALIRQLMIIHTPKYLYALGCNDARDTWLLVRYDRQECIGTNEWDNDYEADVVDEWR